MNTSSGPTESKTVFMLSPAATSWALPLASIFLFSLAGNLGINLFIAFIIVMTLFVLGAIYGVYGIKNFKENRKPSTLAQSIIGVILNICFFALLIAISIPGYLKAMAGN